jgi:homoaconitase/3-isopropylmalate dehydratase large subunit
VAIPPSPADVRPVSQLAGTVIHQAYLGSCTHGSIEDFRLAASLLQGRTIHPSVELLVTPPTRAVYEAALRDGTLATLVAAGATVCSPGCGSCPGIHAGTLTEGQVRISTQSRNFVGRSGHPLSEVYLASPLTVAAAAIRGTITHAAEVDERIPDPSTLP